MATVQSVSTSVIVLLYFLLQIGSSCLMCWGLLASTMDILALVGIYQGKKSLVLPWLLW